MKRWAQMSDDLNIADIAEVQQKCTEWTLIENHWVFSKCIFAALHTKLAVQNNDIDAEGNRRCSYKEVKLKPVIFPWFILGPQTHRIGVWKWPCLCIFMGKIWEKLDEALKKRWSSTHLWLAAVKKLSHRPPAGDRQQPALLLAPTWWMVDWVTMAFGVFQTHISNNLQGATPHTWTWNLSSDSGCHDKWIYVLLVASGLCRVSKLISMYEDCLQTWSVQVQDLAPLK